MARPHRMFESDEYFFVTARTFQSRKLLRPSPTLAAVLGGVLARACKLYKVQLCGFVAASTHVHLLCRVRDGDLPSFMRHFLGNASKKAGPLVGWRGQLWERRYSCSSVLDTGALEGRLRYILAHGVKEGLVRKVHEWPGLSCLPQLMGNPVRAFPFFSWTARWKGGRLVAGGERPWSRQWATDEELTLHPLEHWQAWTPERRQARVREMVAEIEAEGQRDHATVMGIERLLAQRPQSRKEKPNRSPRPWFHSTSSLAGRWYMARYHTFVQNFRAASEKLRLGTLLKAIEFPPFSCAPCVPVRI